MQVVFVEWLDSQSVSGASATSARKEGLLLMTTAGLLVGEDDQVLRYGPSHGLFRTLTSEASGSLDQPEVVVYEH